MKPERLYKHTLVVWTSENYEHTNNRELVVATDEGEAYGEARHTEIITDPADFPPTSFFDIPDPDPYPKPWKVAFRPAEGSTVYDAKGGIVPWEIVTEEMNKEEVKPYGSYEVDIRDPDQGWRYASRTAHHSGYDWPQPYDDLKT